MMVHIALSPHADNLSGIAATQERQRHRLDTPALLARQTALSITIALLMMTPINVSCMQYCIVAKS